MPSQMSFHSGECDSPIQSRSRTEHVFEVDVARRRCTELERECCRPELRKRQRVGGWGVGGAYHFFPCSCFYLVFHVFAFRMQQHW